MTSRPAAGLLVGTAFLVGIGVLSSPASAQTAASRTVLTIHYGAESFPANPVLDAGVRDALTARSDIPIEYFAEYLESDTLPAQEAASALKEYMRRKYQGRRIDVVLAMTDTALRFALDCRPALFPDAPIVFFGVDGPDDTTRSAGPGVTGIRIGVAYAETIKLALTLHPSTTRVFVVARSTNQRATDAVRAELGKLSSQMSVTYLSEETVPRLLDAVKSVPPQSVILYVWHTQVERGSIIYPDAVARLVAAASPVPVYGSSDLYLGTGVVGGVVRGTRETGARMGEMAVRILTGTRAQDIPIENAALTPLVDWRQLERWHVSPVKLPPGTQTLFREPSVWQRDKPYIIAGVLVFCAQAVLIVLLLIQRRWRRIAEEQVRQSQVALRKSYEQVRDLASRLLNAQEGERSRLARELHDDVNQQLAVLNVELALLSRTVKGDGETIAAEAMKRAEGVGKSVRDLSHRLHPPRLLLMGLVPALRGLKSDLTQTGVTITLTDENVPATMPTDVTLALFRIAQEGLQNAIKHSRAHTISLDIRGMAGAVSLTITDDGVGFDVDAAWQTGLGLISLRERAQAIGGTLQIRSKPRVGTRIDVLVPVTVRSNSEAARSLL